MHTCIHYMEVYCINKASYNRPKHIVSSGNTSFHCLLIRSLHFVFQLAPACPPRLDFSTTTIANDHLSSCMSLLILARCTTTTLRKLTAGGHSIIRQPRSLSTMNDSLPPSAAAGSSGSSCSTSNETIKVPAIKLEDREVAVLDLVDGFTKHLAKTRADLPSVECRVAGGWVRDKVSSCSF